MARLSFWFDFASTYSYLSAMRIGPMAQAAGVSVAWTPFLLGPIFAAQGWTSSPFNLYPAKGAYMWRDMARLCDARGLTLVRPDPFPQNSLLAARVAVAIDDPDARALYAHAVFEAQFAEGAQVTEPAVIERCLQKAGLAADLLEAAQDPDIKSRLRAQTESAVQHGIFGAPSFTVGNELFWGDDRLKSALDLAASQAE